jgi:serine/threonine protein kinase
MGVVYLGAARDGGHVAVKLLRPELADDDEFRLRFRREVASLSRIQGLCTVRVIEADTESPRPFLVTEYANGPSLAEHVNTAGPLQPSMLYGLAAGLAEALTAIHAAGVVHRDLKPANVLLTDAGPKVIDFGIAQALDATAVTKTGIAVGSPGFMAPEQITGRPGQAADIFSWGLTIAYAASGKPPFGTGSADAILYRVLHDSPDTDAVPPELRPHVTASLARDPEQRPTARDLTARLTSQAAQAGGTDDADTQTILSRTWLPTAHISPEPAEPRRLSRGAVALSSAAVLAAAAGAGAALLTRGPGHSSLTADHSPAATRSTTASTPTEAATRPSASPARTANLSGTAVSADSYVYRLGYAPAPKSPPWDASAPLNVIVASYTGGASGPMKAFFFGDGKFIGTDTPAGSAAESASRLNGDTFTIQYDLYAVGDPQCCPSGGTDSVRFSWTDGQLQTLDPVPPTAQRF